MKDNELDYLLSSIHDQRVTYLFRHLIARVDKLESSLQTYKNIQKYKPILDKLAKR